jgi:lipoprotein-anchoring transpeptidase ErfK/SrfK
MQHVASAGRRRTANRVRMVGLGASAVALLVLAACTSGATSGNGSPVANGNSISNGAPTTASSSTSPAAETAVITTSPHSGAISPTAPVKVGIRHGKLTGVTMINAAGKHVSGQLDSGGTSWQNTEVLGYAKTYKIVATGVSDNGTRVTKHARVTTLTPNNMTMPYIKDIYGHAVEDGATYGVGMIFRVQFDEPVNERKAEQALQVTTTPSVTGGWYWSDDENAYWRPQHYYAPGTKVTVSAKVYGKDVGRGLFGQADQSVSFKIGEKRVAIANAKTHHVKVYFGDKLVRTMPTSMGQGGVVQGKYGPIYLWTMPGVYTVINHENPAIMSSDSYGLPSTSAYGYPPEKVYWSTKISVDGIYLHELDTTIWAQGHQNVSHGCLNLNYANAHWYYNHSRIGDVVQVIHSGGPKISFNQGGQWSVPWSQWLAGSALH